MVLMLVMAVAEAVVSSKYRGIIQHLKYSWMDGWIDGLIG